MDADRMIQEDVLAELGFDPSIDEAKIGVAVDNAVVTLTGEVTTFAEKLRAEKAALRVRGVRAVANDLTVETTAPHKKTDSEIAQDVVRCLGLWVSVPSEAIKVLVDNGLVTLEGNVEWDHQRRAASRAVSELSGVKGVFNDIAVRPHVAPRDVKRKITAAFHRSAQLDADNIQVDVEGTRVTLRGSVSSWAEKNSATRTAWAAPGVTEVRNLLVVRETVAAV